jgi:hypothetical protein
MRQQFASGDRFDARKPVPEHSHRSGIIRTGREPKEHLQTLARYAAYDGLPAPLEDEG